MSPVVLAALESWSFEPGIALALGVTALVYLRGWRRLHRQMPRRLPPARCAAFLAGLALLYVAVASPLDAFAGLLLQVHMIQHLLLMAVVPPLLLAGAPAVPLIRGLPPAFARAFLGPFLAAPELRRIGDVLAHPLTGWLAMSAATWFWHAPGPYQAALRSPFWHQVEHLSFLTGGILFWWPVMLPWPSVRRWPEWTVPLYLLLADVQNTALAGIFVFSERVLYPLYDEVPRLGGQSALDDQIAAGVVMWVPMSLAFLVPAAVITVRLLSPRGAVAPRREAPERLARVALPGEPVPPGGGLLAGTGIGRLLRSLALRRSLQALCLLLALAVIADGLLGPRMSPMNLAGVLPWTYWRGFTVLLLVAVGNVFCLACPFTLARDLARRIRWARRPWPRVLRTKSIAVALLLVFFWAYETFALWDEPGATALLVAGYFGAAVAVDTSFRGASFCKWVCPIGQFQMVQSLVSPLEVKPAQAAVCAACTTHDCLRGGAGGRGCELELFLPRKAGNLDCTFCLDCARACPHDNVGLVAVAPAAELWRDPERSSLGRLSGRLDVAALALVLVAAGVATAAAMVEPVVRWQETIAAALGLDAVLVAPALLLGSIVVPLPAAMAAVALISHRAIAASATPMDAFNRLSLALLPLGLATWAAHFAFHLVAGWSSALPAARRALGDAGIPGVGQPDWSMPPPLLAADTLLRFEILLLDAGLLLALYSGWRVARSSAGATAAALLPFAAVAFGLWAAAVWVLVQPMEMRGLMVH